MKNVPKRKVKGTKLKIDEVTAQNNHIEEPEIICPCILLNIYT